MIPNYRASLLTNAPDAYDYGTTVEAGIVTSPAGEWLTVTDYWGEVDEVPPGEYRMVTVRSDDFDLVKYLAKYQQDRYLSGLYVARLLGYASFDEGKLDHDGTPLDLEGHLALVDRIRNF